MNSSKWNLVSIAVLSLISTGSSRSGQQQQEQQQKRHVPMSPASQSPNTPPYWEYILREFVFKTMSPPPPGNNELYKRLLDAPFYGGPFPIASSDAPSVVLSRGDVYYLPNGHWLLCQEGCVDCEACADRAQPTLKWILRRIERLASHGSSRRDLQLTIVPQIDGSYHMRNLSPRSYVYVTSQGELEAYANARSGYQAGGGVFANSEDGNAAQHRKSNDFGTFNDPSVSRERKNATREPPETDSREIVTTTVSSLKETVTTAKEIVTTAKETAMDERKTAQRPSRRQRTRVKSSDRRANDSFAHVAPIRRGSIPKLILGTDQSGQKHLIHVVPAEGSANASSSNPDDLTSLNSAGLQYQNKTAYHRVLNRVFDSLSSNRRFIENFLEPLMQTVRTNQQVEEHQQQETRSGFTGLGQTGRVHRAYGGEIRNGSIRKRWPFILNWSRPRRKSNDPSKSNFFRNSTSVRLDSNASYNSDSEMKNTLIDSTSDKSIENKVISDRFNHGSSEKGYYIRNAFNDSAIRSNITRSIPVHKFGPRKYKIVVTTESTTKSLNASSPVVNHSHRTGEQRGSLVSGNHSALHSSVNQRYLNLRNTTR